MIAEEKNKFFREKVRRTDYKNGFFNHDFTKEVIRDNDCGSLFILLRFRQTVLRSGHLGRRFTAKSDRPVDARNSRCGATGNDNGCERRCACGERRHVHGVRA